MSCRRARATAPTWLAASESLPTVASRRNPQSRGAATGGSALAFFSGLGCSAGTGCSGATTSGDTGFSTGAGVATGIDVGADAVEAGGATVDVADPTDSLAVALGDAATAGAATAADAAGDGVDVAVAGTFAAGAPGFSLGSLNWSYFNYTWHTNRDTYDKIVFDDLRNNAMLAAIMVYMASEDPETTSKEKAELPNDVRTGKPGVWPEMVKPIRKGPVAPKN